jgi:uncharacterized protein (DUF1330 family)
MVKAYWIAHLDVNDPIAYENYKAANVDAFSKFTGRVIISGGQKTIKEGTSKTRAAVIEFSDYQTALARYDSPEYQKAFASRRDISRGDLIIVEGTDS